MSGSPIIVVTFVYKICILNVPCIQYDVMGQK